MATGNAARKPQAKPARSGAANRAGQKPVQGYDPTARMAGFAAYGAASKSTTGNGAANAARGSSAQRSVQRQGQPQRQSQRAGQPQRQPQSTVQRQASSQTRNGQARKQVESSRKRTSSAQATAYAKKKMKKKSGPHLFAMFLIVNLVVNLYEPGAAYVKENVSLAEIKEFFNRPPSFSITAPSLDSVQAAGVNPAFSAEGIYSSAAILACVDNGQVLFEKQSSEMVYPASLTKIMTAILAIEYIDAMPDKIVLEPEIFPPLYAANASRAGFSPGEEVTTMDLIYGALLPSGGECTVALANALAGSEMNFAKIMNEKARELGMENTNFVNSTGLHDPQHYTTVSDVMKLLNYALKNETFRTIFTTNMHTTQPTSMRPSGMTFQSNMFKWMGSGQFEGGQIIGGKTGYTGEAGRCLASLAEKDGVYYALVTVGNGVYIPGTAYNIQDALNVYQNCLL